MDAGPARAFLDRLSVATSTHDIDTLVDCFTDDYELTQPAHPARSFTGAAQVRENWEQIFAAVPDLLGQVIAHTVDGATIWSEWELTGTRGDGSRHHLCGVMIFGLREDRAAWGRFFLEPVDSDPAGVDEAIRRQVQGAGT